LGSVQPFPRKPGRSAAEAWRLSPAPASGVRVRLARLEDYAAVRAVARRDGGPDADLTLRQFEQRRNVFPEGQWVAEGDGGIVGAGFSLILDGEEIPVEGDWNRLTAEGTFASHDPAGTTLFACDQVADPARHGFAVPRALHLARTRLCRRLGLRRVAAALRLRDYEALREVLSPEEYVRRAIWGTLDDTALRFYFSQGYQLCAMLPGFAPHTESAGHAALLAWLDPLYTSPGPGASEQKQRPRKCA
jgi:hypothetical protein